jgi:Cdc6-like AAA superfamily ATPase
MFTGRRDILQQIIQFFDGPRSSIVLKMQKIFVLYGLGGAGKTATMMKFVDEFSDRYAGFGTVITCKY